MGKASYADCSIHDWPISPTELTGSLVSVSFCRKVASEGVYTAWICGFIMHLEPFSKILHTLTSVCTAHMGWSAKSARGEGEEGEGDAPCRGPLQAGETCNWQLQNPHQPAQNCSNLHGEFVFAAMFKFLELWMQTLYFLRLAVLDWWVPTCLLCCIVLLLQNHAPSIITSSESYLGMVSQAQKEEKGIR